MAADFVIALDVDGVLIDSRWRPGETGWLDIVGPRFGVDRDDMAGFFQGNFKEAILGRQPIEEVLAAHFRSIGHDIDAVEFVEAWLKEDSCLNDEVVIAAEGWARAGMPIVLATTQEHRRAAHLQELLGERLGLRDVIYSALLGVEKPSPEYFRIADERIGHRPVIFIDDALSNVEAARAHGWTAIHYPAEANWREIVERNIGVHGSR